MRSEDREVGGGDSSDRPHVASGAAGRSHQRVPWQGMRWPFGRTLSAWVGALRPRDSRHRDAWMQSGGSSVREDVDSQRVSVELAGR